MPDLQPCIPLPVEENVLIDVVSKAKDWALMHGAAMRSKSDFNSDALQVGYFICQTHAIVWIFHLSKACYMKT